MALAMIWWIIIPALAHMVTKDSTVKMMLMSVLHHRVSIMPPVATILEDIPASANQDTLEGCAIQTSTSAQNRHARTGLARIK